MNLDVYKRLLVDLRASFAARLSRDESSGQQQDVDSPADAGDRSVVDESESEDFTEAELDATVLQEIDDALRRIADGTYGRCAVDGGPIEEKRLNAVPWARYCIKHQTLLEAASRPKPTL
jgi:RNA polymerase-binding transcription factor